MNGHSVDKHLALHKYDAHREDHTKIAWEVFPSPTGNQDRPARALSVRALPLVGSCLAVDAICAATRLASLV